MRGIVQRQNGRQTCQQTDGSTPSPRAIQVVFEILELPKKNVVQHIACVIGTKFVPLQRVMAAKGNITIRPERYEWAIQRNGDTLDTYYRKYPKSKLFSWISGDELPTMKQLENFAKSVNVPLGYLFLEEVPEEQLPFPVFRGNAGVSDHFDLNVYDVVNIVRQRQDWLEDYISENELDVCNIVSSITTETPVLQAVRLLRQTLELSPRWAFSLLNTDAAVNILTEHLEVNGIFVAYNGIVGNNTRRKIKVSECRGFALVNKIAPFVFVNTQDAKTAQLFTLIHETAHLMLGISAGHADANESSSSDINERYCDAVAAEFLVPSSELNFEWNGDIRKMARLFKVSEPVIARRAHNLGLLSDDRYNEFWREYNSRPILENKKSAGGDFYRSSVKRIGKTLAIHIKNAVNNRQLSYVDAYRLTGLYGKTYDTFMTNI